MSEASYHQGLTIEPDFFLPELRIEGVRVSIEKRGDSFIYKEHPEISAPDLIELGRKIIESWWEIKDNREDIKQEHLKILQEGVKIWNQWRKENPQIRPILYKADLFELGKNWQDEEEPIDFSFTNLIEADLRHAVLKAANFHEANLGQADLSFADLSGAHFCRTDLYKTNLSHAILHRANLQGTQLAMTIFSGAELIGCKIYGMSAWDLEMDDTTVQKELQIVYTKVNDDGKRVDDKIIVDDLRVAQFIYLLLHNQNIRYVLDTIATKAVLILGRFTPERKEILDAIANELRKNDLLPVIFDFVQPISKDFTETIKTLAGISFFVIADISNPKSAPLELQATVPDYQIPFVPILQQGEEPFSMFRDLIGKYNWVLQPVKYNSSQELLDIFKPAIIDRAWAKRQELQKSKNQDIQALTADDFLQKKNN